jgi:type II secretory pathway component PulF
MPNPMPLTFTPSQLSRRADFYHQLGQLTGAGFGIVQTFDRLRSSPPDRSYRIPLTGVLQLVNDGSTMAEAFRSQGHWLPEFDLSLLEAGEQSGQLDASFRLLTNYYRDRSRVARQLIADLIYPLFLLHFAVFIFPFPRLFLTGDVLAYAQQVGIVLVPLYLLVLLLIYACQSRHGEQWRAWLESFLSVFPVLGTARRYLALSRLSAALEALLRAGVNIIQAWELAATASGSPALRRLVLGWRPLLDGGRTPAEVISDSGRFPEVFASQYASGEISGKLDETLARLHEYYQEEGTRKLHTVAQWTPRAIYLVIVFMIAYRVIMFWSGYFQQIQNAIGP